MARLQIGLDMRVTREVAIAPYVSGGIDVFFSEKLPNINARNLDPIPVSGWFGAGLLGRFDIGGRYIAPVSSVAARASR